MNDIESIIKEQIGQADYIWVSGKQIPISTLAEAISQYVIKARIEELEWIKKITDDNDVIMISFVNDRIEELENELKSLHKV